MNVDSVLDKYKRESDANLSEALAWLKEHNGESTENNGQYWWPLMKLTELGYAHEISKGWGTGITYYPCFAITFRGRRKLASGEAI